MNNSSLESKLKSVRVPERGEEYWEDFPSRVRLRLRQARSLPPAQENSPAQLFCKWGLSFAGIILLLLVLNQPLKAASQAVFKKEHSLQQQLTTLPAHLKILMADEHGLDYLVADKE